MRSYEFRQRQRAKRRKWATKIVSRWADPASPKGRREVGKVATTHTFCGCTYCRAPKTFDIPTPRHLRSTEADRD